MVIWEYDVPAAARSLGWAVVANNIEALKILLDCGYGTAGLLVAVGAASRWVMARGVLWGMGLEGMDSGWSGLQAGEPGKAGGGFGGMGWGLVKEWGGRLGGL